MNRLTLATAAAAAALALGTASAGAQMQQKGPEGGPQMQGPPGGQPQAQEKAPDASPRTQAPPSGKSQAQQKKQETGPQGAEKAEPKGKTQKGAQSEPKEKAPKSAAEPKGQASPKGTAEKKEPADKGTKGSAQKSQQPQDKGTKGTAEKAPEPQDKATKGAATKGSGERVQLSQEQRTNVGHTLLKDQRVNRVTNVNFSISVGARVPRNVRLVALPVSVVGIVPAYRSYRYFVVEERIVVVDPASYEIVEVIETSDRTAAGSNNVGTSSRLALTEEEKSIILSEVDMNGGSTLALGALTEGAEVPRDVELRVFPAAIVEKVPKVRDHKFFTAENRVAIVDPQGAKVQLVIGERR